MGEETEKGTPGRPRGVPSYKIEITTADQVTYKMLEALRAYGRFGKTIPEIALFIIRLWLMDKEEYLKGAIAVRRSPLGIINTESDSDD